MTTVAPTEPRPAATILLVRDRPAFEVLMVRRHHQIDFAAGALVFPGGKAHAGDHDPRWRERVSGGAAVGEGEARALRIAAIREAFEEAGVLLARHEDGRCFAGSDQAQAARIAIAEDRLAFVDLLAALRLRLDLDALSVFARWITPTIMPKRFDTWFFIARPPAAQLATCDGREAVEAQWIAPAEALRLAEAGERTIIFPTRLNLKLLAEAASAEDAIAAARARPLVTVEPKLIHRPEGPALVIAPDAGYGAVTEPLSRAM